LEEQDSSADQFDSCLYNIVDGDELTIEPVNVTINTNNKNTLHADENASTIKEIINNDNNKSDVITTKLNENSNGYQDSKINDVCIKKF